MTHIDRRTFVIGGTAIGLSAAAGIALVGCTREDQSNTEDSQAEPGLQKESQQNREPQTTTPLVYMTSEITPESLVRIFDALMVPATGRVAIKVSTGEPGGNNYLKPELIKDFVQATRGTIVECNTAYGGSRSRSASHYQVAEDHGFTAIADVDIMDEEGSISLPINNGKHLSENQVGSHFENYDFFVSLAHFKGHAMAGYGGAIKNVSIGIASSSGKSLIHSGGTQTTGFGSGTPQDTFLESMGESAKSIADQLGRKIVYINVMNKLSVDCDCDSNPAEPDMADIGILASTDPVAVDKACVDLVYAAGDGASLIQRIESRNGLHTLDYAQSLGLGSTEYELIEI